MCTCPKGDETCYVLGDMDLLGTDGESTSEFWHKLEEKASGTRGMIPPEVHNLQCMDCYVCSSLLIINIRMISLGKCVY